MSEFTSPYVAPRLLTTREAATALRVTSETIRRRAADGTIRSVRIGRVIRIPAEEIDRVLATGRRSAA